MFGLPGGVLLQGTGEESRPGAPSQDPSKDSPVTQPCPDSSSHVESESKGVGGLETFYVRITDSVTGKVLRTKENKFTSVLGTKRDHAYGC